MSTNSKETLAKKQQEDLNSTFNNLPWGLPLGFPTMSPFGAFPAFGLPTPNFPPLTPTAPSLLSNDSANPSTSTDVWSNGLSSATNPIDYNEYAKQLGFFMNAFNEQQQQEVAAADKPKTKTSIQPSPNTKHSSKTKHSHSSASPDVTNGKKKHDDSRRSSTSSTSRSKSSINPSASSSNKTSTPTSTTAAAAVNPDPTMLDPMAFAAAAAAAAASGGLTFPYFLPSLLSQTPSTTGTNANPSTYPFSSLTSSLTNPAAGLYPFLSPDWFTSPGALGNITPDSKQSKKRSKSIRTLAEEQEKNASTSLLHSALSDSLHTNGLRLSRRSSTTDTPGDDTKSNDDDDSDPNPKRKKTEEVNETLVRIPLNRGWKRVTIVRAITRTGVRGDVAYYAPCGRKLRSFQEIDRYLSKKNITDLDRSNFTFSSKVHIGFFHEPKEGSDGKTIFQESTEDEIVNRILEINPKFRRIETSISPCLTPNNGTHDHDESSKRINEMKTSAASAFQHNDFIKALIEQQKLVQQQEFEHKQKFQQEQQEQERKRQELAYLKQLEFKKRQEEKLVQLEQRKAEKNAQREKKIQEKYIEIVQTKEAKRIVEDMQLKDLKELPILKPVENMRLSIEAFANCLMIMEFLNNFKHILNIPDTLIPSLNNFQQSLLNTSSTRDLSTLCQILLRTALDDPGIPNPKKALTNLGQKLSEIDITEHTFSEILRIYIRERNGFDDKLTQILSDNSFQALNADEKAEILAFLCNDLSTNKRVVEEVDRNLDELTGLKHEKWEIEKRLRRLKFEKYNNSNSNPNVKKMANLIREKDLNSSDNESPDETDDETSTTINDPAATTADDQDIETLDETKIDDLEKRFTLVARKYTLIKRRVIHKQCRIRTLHLGQDRYRRRYWYFSHLPGIYIEGLTSGDIPADDILTTVESVTKQKFDNKPTNNGNDASHHTSSRSTQRRTKQQQQTQARSSISIAPIEPSSNPIESTKTSDNEDDKQTTNASEDLATMDLSAFCMAVNRDNDVSIEQEQPITNGIKTEPSEEVVQIKTEETVDDDLPLDLSCSKSKRPCQDDYWTAPQHSQTIYPLKKNLDQFQELNDLATAAMLLNNIKQEQTNINIQNLITTPIKQETPSINFKEIEQTIREKYQFAQPLPIPDDVQSGWWIIQTPDELRSLIKSLVKRGQRERYLCRMLQRYFDVLTQSMLNPPTNEIDSNGTTHISTINDDENENEHDEQQNSNDSIDNEHQQNFDDTHEMDVLNEIYNLSDRIITSSLHCRSYDIESIRKRLSYSDIQAKGSEILDEAKHLLTDLERNIERRYLKHPFVRRYELNLSSLNRINQNSTYHHTQENSTNEIVSSSKYDEVPQQLERWRRTVNESRTPAQLALCLTQLERCIAWEKSIMRVFCQICNSDVDEEKLLLCDGCDHGTHTFCFNPPMSFIPPNDWYCYVCIGKAKGENLCFVCGNKGEQALNRCDTCNKLFHEDCLKNARQQRGKWLCVQCLANDSSALIASLTSGNNTNAKWSAGRQTSRSSKTRQPSITSNGADSSSNRNRPANNNNTNNRKSTSKSRPSESSILQESHSNSSHADLNESSSVQSADDIDDSIPSPTIVSTNSKKKSAKKSKANNNNNNNNNGDIKSCRIILNELLKSDASWPFQTPVDAKQHPEYYECIKTPMDFSTMKKKMRNNQYTKREDFFNDVQLILNNCEYYNEDDSPVGEAGHVLRTFFEAQWAKQFG